MRFNKLPLKIGLCFIFTSFSLITQAQSPSGYVADWKNDAQGAYTIIHDDYGDPGVDGIWQYADTIAYNRGVKFTFGAIAGSCENNRNINGYSNPYGYAQNVMMAQHNHEIISHSHTHQCAVGAGWNPCDGSGGIYWGEQPNSPDFTRELVTAHNSITNNTGFAPVYYIFPYDRFTHAANDKLKELDYIGSRTGWDSPFASDAGFHRNGYENNDLASFYPDADGFFRTGVQVFDDNDNNSSVTNQVNVLNGEVDNAIANNMWANRELHNVGPTGWGSVRIDAYRQHIDYLKSKVESGELWVGTVSEIITYQIQKLKYSGSKVYDAPNEKIYVNWATQNPQYNVNVANYLAPLSIKTALTYVVDLDGLTGDWAVKQNGVDISTFTQDGGKVIINAYPHEGDLELYKANQGGNQSPYVQNAATDYNSLLVDFSDFTVDLNDVFQDAETSDLDLVYSASGYTGITVVINNGIATISSTSGWTGSTNITFTAEDEGGLTATDIVGINVIDLFAGQTPFNGTPISIPGRIEAEDYDNGGQGIAYNEVATNWEPDPADNPYRPNSGVDVGEIANTGEYAVGFAEASETIEYTIDVMVDGWYTVTLNTAQLLDGNNIPEGQIKLLIDNQEWKPTTVYSYTSSWTDFQRTEYPNALFLTAGKHLLTMEFVSSSTNVDYIEILNSPTYSSEVIANANFGVYPNPAKKFVKIDAEFNTAEIFSQTGALVKTSTNNEINVEDLAKGIYYVKLDTYSQMTKLIITK